MGKEENIKKDEIIKIEEELRNSIIEDFDFNYFIEAGAGAGKTKLVVDRITCQLASGKYKPEEIVAITFTNKAAQELCDRIRKNLAEAATAQPENEDIQSALRNIGRMQISTIHSFCHRILKENCFDAKLRLDFELLEEKDSDGLKSEFFKEWFNRNAELFTEFSGKCPQDVGYGDLQGNFSAICDLPDNVIFRYESIESFDTEALEKLKSDITLRKQKVVDTYIAAVEAELGSPIETGNPLYGKKFSDDKFRLYLSKTFQTDDVNSLFSAIAGKECPFRKRGDKNLGISISNSLKERFIAIGEAALDKVREDVEKINADVKSNEEALINTLILEFILKARKEYRELKFNHFLTNDILLQKVDKLLDNKDVISKLRMMFKCIYLDESQDTDPVQNELIMKICKDGDEFIPGRLFIVGDVKQSIYRFREADYRIFNATKGIFNDHPDTCKVKSLNINNRSNNDLVDFFNKKVKELPKGLIPDYEPMTARNDYRVDPVVHGVYKIESKVHATGKDWEQVVRLVKHLVGKQQICTFNTETEKLETRPVEYRDILVLTRKAKEMDEYVNAFQNAGIPVRASVEYTPGSMPPLRRFAVIYRYLAMPYYKRAKEGMLEIAQNDTSCRIEDNAGKLREWKKEVSQLNGAEIIGWLLEHSELYMFDSAPVKGCLIKRYQMAIRQMVDQILSNGEKNALRIADALKEYISEDNTCEREIGFDKDENAVRFMNIHKAKGLEGNIVIIAQRKNEVEDASTYTENNERYQTVFHRINKKSKNYYSAYALKPEIAENAVNEQRKEDARFEYVAVTRAREALIFMPPMGKDNNNPIFSNYIDESVREFYDIFPFEATEEIEAESEESGTLLHAKAPDKKIYEETRYKVSPSTMEVPRVYIPKKSEAVSASEDDKIEVDKIFDDDKEDVSSLEAVSESSDILQKRPSGDIFGTVMHRAFELAVHEIRNGGCNWQLCINRAINENNDDIDSRYKAAAEEEKAKYKAFLEEKLPVFVSFVSGTIKEADEVFTEFPFSLTVSGDELRDIKNKLTITSKIAEKMPSDGDEDSKTVWINGKADLIIKKGDITTIWDYKSDKDVTAKDIHDRYDNQMNLYKWVFEKYFSGNIEGNFYSLEIGKA